MIMAKRDSERYMGGLGHMLHVTRYTLDLSHLKKKV